MCLDPEDHIVWLERTESLSTEKLHELDLYWKEHSENTVDEQLHGMVEMVLQYRGEKTLKQLREERIEVLNKCLSISHPLGIVYSNGKFFILHCQLCLWFNLLKVLFLQGIALPFLVKTLIRAKSIEEYWLLESLETKPLSTSPFGHWIKTSLTPSTTCLLVRITVWSRLWATMNPLTKAPFLVWIKTTLGLKVKFPMQNFSLLAKRDFQLIMCM